MNVQQNQEPQLIMILQALGDDMRLAIVRLLAMEGERACGTFALPITKSTLSHHLSILREAGIIVQRDHGTRRLNSLNRAWMEQHFPGLLEAVLAT